MVSVQSNRGGHAAFMEGAPMLDTTTFVGLDVHARSIKAVSFDVMTGEACRQGRAEAGREARGPTRARGPRQQGERGHGARARLLGMGGRPHGRGGVGGVPPHISRSPRKRLYPKPLRRTSGPFSASAQGATRVRRLSVRRRSLSRSNGLPGERSPRADIKLQRRASERHAEVAAEGLI